MNTYRRVLLLDHEIHSPELLGSLFSLSKTRDMCIELALQNQMNGEGNVLM